MRHIPEIIDQHAEEAAFLWLLRDQAVVAANYSLPDLAELDERIEAHLDGLRIAGTAGWVRAHEELLAQGEAGEAFATAVLACEAGDAEKIEAVVAVAAPSPEARRGLISALGWLPAAPARRMAEGLLAAEEPGRRLAGLAGLAVRRDDPALALDRALQDEDPALRARALRAAGELGRPSLLPRIAPHLESEEPACRFHAARSLALLGRGRTAAGVLLEIAEESLEAGEARAEEALALACRLLPRHRVRRLLRALAGGPETQRLAILGAGASGDPDRLPWLIEAMARPELARAAGEAFTLITGLDLAAAGLEGEWPEGYEAGPSEDPADEDVALDPDEDLPIPDPSAVLGWWRRHGEELRAQGVEGRLAFGERPGEAHLHAVLRGGRQRQRAAAALELALIDPGRPLFEVRAPARAQLRLLSNPAPAAAMESA